MPSNLESGSKRKNVLSVFHNHPDLSLPGEHIDLDELLLDDPGYFIYELEQEAKYLAMTSGVGDPSYSTESVIEINRSDQYLKEHDILLEALITHKGILNGTFLEEKYVEIVNAHTAGYVEEDHGNVLNHLAVIPIPKNFDQNNLEMSIDAAVNMMKQTVELQRDLLKTAKEFRTERF